MVAQPGSSQEGIEFGAQSEDGGSSADGLYGNRGGGELDAIGFHGEKHEAGKKIVQSFRAKVDRTKKIDVSRGPSVRAEPMAK